MPDDAVLQDAADQALRNRDSAAVIRVARAFADLDDFNATRSLFERACSEWDDGELWHHLGDVRVEDGEVASGIAAFTRAHELGFPSLIDRALAFEAQGDDSRAEEDYRAALETDEDAVDAGINLALLRLRAGEVDEARALLLTATTSDPKAHWQLAGVYTAEGRQQEALWALDAAIRAGERRALHDRALLTQSTRDADAVIADFEGAIDAGSTAAGASLVIYLDTVLDDPVRAREIGERQVARGDRAVYAHLAIVLESLGELEHALHYYDLAIAHGDVGYTLDAEKIRVTLQASATSRGTQ